MELTPKTRKEVFLAAAAGQDVTTPTPVTREEVFLDAIAKGGGGGGGSSGGGVLVVHAVASNGGNTATLDTTWQDINDAIAGGTPCFVISADWDDALYTDIVTGVYYTDDGTHYVETGIYDTSRFAEYTASSASGYPSRTFE